MKQITLAGGTPGAVPVRRRATYFVGVFSKNGRLKAIKIGLCTYGKHEQRLRTLQTGSRETLKLLGVTEGAIEKRLHREFAGFRTRGEFFKPAPVLLRLIENLNQIQEFIRQIESKESTTNSGRLASSGAV